MRLVELCAGIGAMSYVWQDVLGQEVAGQVEIDPFCLRVLEAHFPDVPRRMDIREVAGDEFGDIDLLAAGFPCQPASVAGKRRGASDDRWLWPEVYRIIRSAQPAWVLLENVPGLLSMGLDDVLTDLGDAGYEAWPLVLPAASVGAPHLRERVFIVCHLVAYAADGGIRRGRSSGQHRQSPRSDQDVADADTERQRQLQGGQPNERRRAEGIRSLAHAASARPQGQERAESPIRGHTVGRSGASVAHAISGQRSGWPAVREWHDDAGRGAGCAQETDDTRQRPSGTRRARHAESRVGRAVDGLSAWLDGHQWPAGPGEAQHEWEAPRTVTGRVPERAARLKALGNAIVPQQVAPILAAILHTHLTYGQEAA